jgi:transcriptional regulator with XRE-family HTH domain
MKTIEVTGGMLLAARSLVSLSQEQVAKRADVSRPVLTLWENSSVLNAKYGFLLRVVRALEAEGVCFRDDGVFLDRPTMTAQIANEIDREVRQ